jgi:hypothetical protein
MMLAGLAPLAQASIQITYYYDGAAIGTTCTAGATDAQCNLGNAFTVGDLAISGLTAHSNLTGSPSIAVASSSNSSITNNGLVTLTLHIDVVAQGYIQPVTPPALDFKSHIGTTTFIAPDTASTFAFRSCVDQSNAATGCTTVGAILSALLHPDISSTISSAKDAPSINISTLNNPYAIAESIDISLSAGESINFAGSTTLTPVPEPMSIALLGGAVLLTSRLIRRKQNQAS